MKHPLISIQHFASEKNDLEKGIELKVLHHQAIPPPPSYHAHIMSSTGHSESQDASRSRRDPQLQPQPRDANLTMAEKQLHEHINSARIRVWHESPDQGDWLVDLVVYVLRICTVLGLVFMIVYTAYKWWSLGHVIPRHTGSLTRGSTCRMFKTSLTFAPFAF